MATVEEYARNVMAEDGLSLLLRENDFAEICPTAHKEKKKEMTEPIGMKLHRDRATNSTFHDCAERHERITASSNKWKAALFELAGLRSVASKHMVNQSNNINKNSSGNNADNNKRKAQEDTDLLFAKDLEAQLVAEEEQNKRTKRIRSLRCSDFNRSSSSNNRDNGGSGGGSSGSRKNRDNDGSDSGGGSRTKRIRSLRYSDSSRNSSNNRDNDGSGSGDGGSRTKRINDGSGGGSGNSISRSNSRNSTPSNILTIDDSADARNENPNKPNSNNSKPPRVKKVCCFKGCKNNNVNYTGMRRVRALPKPLRPNATNDARRQHAANVFIRREWTDRLYGKRKAYDKKDLRMCGEHTMTMVKGKTTTCIETTKEGAEREVSFTIEPFEAPVSLGDLNAAPTTLSEGLGTDREIVRYVKQLSFEESRMSPTARTAIARETVHEQNKDNNNDDGGGKARIIDHNDKPSKSSQPSSISKITLSSLTPAEVKRRTGFHYIKELLTYTAICYGGDLDAMVLTATKLDWLEEIVLYYEFSYGRTLTRWADWQKEYGANKRTLRKAIKYRSKKELECRERWPMYASYKEDAKFRDAEKWSEHFDTTKGARPIMHDGTNIELPQPSSGDMNRALHNVYYNMCCAKAGVAAQLCSWIHGLPLCTGHCDDDQLMKFSKTLEQQKEFAENDKVNGELISFLNIFDKGYHQLLETKRLGQTCLQPDKVDSLTECEATLRAAAVAVVRSGNERAVLRSKLSWFISRGMKYQMWDIDLLCDIWEAWTFRVNFMYQGYQ